MCSLVEREITGCRWSAPNSVCNLHVVFCSNPPVLSLLFLPGECVRGVFANYISAVIGACTSCGHTCVRCSVCNQAKAVRNWSMRLVGIVGFVGG